MAPGFSLQTPYVVASLPRPIDHTKGRYVIGNVYGGVPGTKKRKRAELAVGIDGEGVNLYDISASRLLSSYALPPQSTFTCPPASIRTKSSKVQTERRTYVSTIGPQAQIVLFKEIAEGSAASTSTTTTRDIESGPHPVVFLGTITASRGTDTVENTSDLILVREDGEVKCYHGDSLEKKWSSPASALNRDASNSVKNAVVEFAQLTNAYSASQGLLKGRQDILAVFSQEITEEGFNPELLVLITSASSTRTIHIASLHSRHAAQSGVTTSPFELLLSEELPSQDSVLQSSKPKFSLQPSTGTLQQLAGNSLYSFNLSSSLPKVTSRLSVTGAQSFLRISSTSIMVSTEKSITVLNPKYQSILASLELEDFSKSDSLKRKRDSGALNGSATQTCDFVAYFPKLGSAVAIAGNNLLTIQIEGQRDRRGRPRTTGLLIDSIGRAVKDQLRSGRTPPEHTIELGLKTLDSYLPGSLGIAEAPWAERIARLEDAGSNDDAPTFDELMAENLGVRWADESKVNGDGPATSISKDNDFTTLRPSSTVDRRWIAYALSKIFSISSGEETQKLSITFYPPNVFMWLLRTGNMTTENIETALRTTVDFEVKPVQAGNLVDLLVELDPDMDLLLALISKNFLGAPELLHAIRRLMESLGMFGEQETAIQGLLTNGDGEIAENEDAEEQLRQLEAEAENDLATAEYQLGSRSGVRGEALSLALSKLYTCPPDAITYALQTTFNIAQIVSLLYLLRFELARGAWTSRYLDHDQSDVIDENAEIPNHAIVLISSLLNNCVDAIGAGGWLSGDARLVNGDPFEAEEMIASLKLEISAALEGIEESMYLKGLSVELVRYGESVLKSLGVEKESEEAPATKKSRPAKPIAVPMSELGKLLPFGLKADQLVSLLRVGAGGEVERRTMRDVGHKKSQKVGKYTRERIVV